MAETQRKAWDRLDEEGQDEWEMFEAFLRLRDEREVAKQFFDADQVSVGHAYVATLGKRRKWQARVAAFDRWVNAVKDDALATAVRREIRAIGTRKIKLLRKMQRIVDRVAEQVYPSDAAQEYVVKIADAVQFGKLSQVLLEEYRRLEEANPAASETNPYSNELTGAMERLKAAADASKGKKPGEEPSMPAQEAAVKPVPVPPELLQ